MQNAYRYHDLMLGRLMELAGPDCAVMLISDHGFHSDRLLPDYIPAEAAGPAVEHRHFGIFCMQAPGVQAGGHVYGASVLDIAPTALHVLGLPAGMDMDGKVLLNAFADGRPLQNIPSWERWKAKTAATRPARSTMAPRPPKRSSNWWIWDTWRRPAKDSRDAVADCLAEQRYNLARAHADACGRTWRCRCCAI